MVTLKRVGINSAFKIGAMIGLITAVISGVLLAAMQAVFLSAFAGLVSMSASNTTLNSPSPADFADMTAAFGLVGLCIFIVVYVVISTIVGGISGIIWAFAYNQGARWVGGLELEFDEEAGKRKRVSVGEDDIFE